MCTSKNDRSEFFALVLEARKSSHPFVLILGDCVDHSIPMADVFNLIRISNRLSSGTLVSVVLDNRTHSAGPRFEVELTVEVDNEVSNMFLCTTS